MATQRLTQLQKQRADLDRKIKAEEQKAAAQQRKDDTRRKIIAGALAMNHMEKNPDSDFAKLLLRLLDEYVTKPNERKLMGLDSSQPTNDNAPKEGSLRAEFSP